MAAVPAASFGMLLMTFLMGGAFGLPVSLPPAEPHEMMYRLAPEACMYYSCLSGAKAADGASGNQTEAMFAEPEVQLLVKELERQGLAALNQMGQQNPQAAMAAEMVPTLVRVLLTRPICFYLGEVEAMGPNGVPTGSAGVAIKLGPYKADVEKLLQLIPADATQPVTIANEKFRQMRLPPQAPPVVFGMVSDYLLLAVGEDEMKNLLARASTPAPAWLTELRQRYDVPRISTISFANLGEVMKMVSPLAPPPVAGIIQQIGLDNVKQFVSVTGLDDRGFVGFSALDFNGPVHGMLGAAVGGPLTAEELAVIPRDPYLGVATRLDLAGIYDAIREFVGGLNPNATAQFDAGMREVEGGLGMRVREDLMAALGDVWTLAAAPEDGGLLAGWTATVSLKDAATVKRAVERLRQLAAQNGGPRSPQILSTPFGGQEIQYLMVPDPQFPVAPSWCVTEKHLVIGLFPQAIKSFLRRQQEGGESLAAAPEVAPTVARGGAVSIAYVNHKRIVELVYPMVQYGVRMGLAEAARNGVEIDFALLPSPTSITRHIRPGVSFSRKTERGLESEKRQSLPGGSMGATLPVAVALILPAVQSARAAARRMSSSNNLKQIMLALHNYHDSFRGFPALYGVDANGKPLLSWRVYILPFVEEQALFEQFHLDEPWDSEHNKKLIPRMPQTYRSPDSRALPGHTRYLGLVNEKSALQPTKKAGEKFPIGSRIADITDGTSNTVCVVEANDALAVPWTKPADYEYSTEDPMQGLRGTYPGGCQVGLCDGSVRFLSDIITVESLLALFTRNGGEVVGDIP